MKTNRFEQQTIETLSAYLDGQLSEHETEVVRQQLENSAALRQQLDALRQTRYVLRHTPRLKRRRSFVLSPQMVQQQKTLFRALNVSRAISAAASVLLVVALGSQYLFSGGMGLASAPMMDTANYEMAEAVAADDAAEEQPMMAMEAPAEEAVEEPALDSAADQPAEAEQSAEAPMAEPQEELGSAQVTETEAAASMLADEPIETTQVPAGEPQATELPSGGGGEPPEAESEAPVVEETAMPTATPEDAQRSTISEKDADGLQAEGAPEELPDDGLLEPIDEGVLYRQSTSRLDWLAFSLMNLNIPFIIRKPPELYE